MEIFTKRELKTKSISGTVQFLSFESSHFRILYLKPQATLRFVLGQRNAIEKSRALFHCVKLDKLIFVNAKILTNVIAANMPFHKLTRTSSAGHSEESTDIFCIKITEN